MNKDLPQISAESELGRQAEAFFMMLSLYGLERNRGEFSLVLHATGNCWDLTFRDKTVPLPFIFGDSWFSLETPTALELRHLSSKARFLIFDESPSRQSLELWQQLRDELRGRSPYEPAFSLVCPKPQDVRDCSALASHSDLEILGALSPEFKKNLLAADAVLVNASNYPHNLISAAHACVPAASYAIGEVFPAEFEHVFAVQEMCASDLADTLLLLLTDSPMRLSVLKAQDRLIRKFSYEQQFFRFEKLLKDLGIAALKTPQSKSIPAQSWRVEGLFDSSYSLAIVNRNLAMSLDRAGQKVSLLTFEQGPSPNPHWAASEQPDLLEKMWREGIAAAPPQVSLRNAWPPIVKDMRGEVRVLASYAWEETGFPPEFVSSFNLHLDLITTVSAHVKRALRDAGVFVPIAIVGNGIDHLQHGIATSIPQSLTPAKFRFLHISSCFPRKGVDVLLKAYGRAFRKNDDVSLVIKTFENPHNSVRQQLDALCKFDPQFPKVDLITQDWSQSQILGLYKMCHALVAPSRAEGFGLPIAEAMLEQIPVITTGWGGQMDFCDEDTSWLIDFDFDWAKTHMGLDRSVWAEPSETSLVGLLREMVCLTAVEKEPKLKLARKRVLERYTWDGVASRTIQAVEGVLSAPLSDPTLKIAWVSTWASRCGVAMYSDYMVNGFKEDSLFILAPKNEVNLTTDAENVRRVWSLGATSLEDLVREVMHLDVEAVVIQFHWAFFSVYALADAVIAFRARKMQVIIEMHNTLSAPPEMSNEYVRRALGSENRILVHALSDLKKMKKLGFVENVALFPLAAYPQSQPKTSALDELRDSLKLGGSKVIATYGFMMPHKGLTQMVRALPEILSKIPDVKLLMVNAIYSLERSGAELATIESDIQRLGLADRVILKTDFLPDAESVKLLSLADLIVLPYQVTEESSSAAVRMALACARPVAVTPIAFFDDVRRAVNTLPGISPDAIATGVVHLLHQFRDRIFFNKAVDCSRSFTDQNDVRRLSSRLRAMVIGEKSDRETGVV